MTDRRKITSAVNARKAIQARKDKYNQRRSENVSMSSDDEYYYDNIELSDSDNEPKSHHSNNKQVNSKHNEIIYYDELSDPDSDSDSDLSFQKPRPVTPKGKGVSKQEKLLRMQIQETRSVVDKLIHIKEKKKAQKAQKAPKKESTPGKESVDLPVVPKAEPTQLIVQSPTPKAEPAPKVPDFLNGRRAQRLSTNKNNVADSILKANTQRLMKW